MQPEFIQDYEQFIKTYDEKIAGDRCFKESAMELYQLVEGFLEKYQKGVLETSPFACCPGSNFPKCSYSAAIEEDMRILAIEQDDKPKNDVCEQSKRCANFYLRASHAHYVTESLNELSKTPAAKTHDRHKPFQFARLAIRHDNRNARASLRYIMALGWYIDIMRVSLEKVALGKLFYHSIKHLLWLEPNNALGHHLLGRYYYSVATLSWIERTLARQLIEARDLDFKLADAKNALQKAYSLDPSIPTNGLWMVRVLLAAKAPRDQISEWIEFGLKARCKDPVDEIERGELEVLKKKEKF